MPEVGTEAGSEPRKVDEGHVRRTLEALCQELNMDEQTGKEALQSFTAIWDTYTLEGEVAHWLACSLYAACRKGWTPTVGKGVMEGNCVSLTRILRSSKLSLIQFFSKMKKWADMSSLSREFRERIARLERNFEVSTVIFKKFEPIFVDMFQDPQGEPPRPARSRKHRRLPCHVSDVFKFCWTLFVYTKGNFRMIGDDLVNSYHLLLCCLDLVFGNALLCPNRKDLINPLFKGLPKDYHSPDYSAPEEPLCVIDKLCELHDGLVVEAKGIKEHYFKPYINKLFERQILRGNQVTLTELLDTTNFIDNNKAVNREYEEYVLTVGDFDERVFLGADADEEIGTPRKVSVEPPEGRLSARMQVECNLQQHFDKARSFAPSTPLTGRRYLKEKEAIVTPVSSATQSVSRLQGMVTGLRNAPSEQLLQIFRSCSRDPTETILNRVKTLGELFRQHYTRVTEDHAASHMDFADNRLKLAEILYYKILENVMVLETRRLHGKDMAVLLEQDIFHRSLMACCLEVVLFAYSSQRTFPWIIDILNLRPFYFYKVIEVFIRSEEGLSRDMVKHLNNIEEQILECRAWSSGSALWEALEAAHSKVPTVEEVTFPSNFETGSGSSGPAHLPLVALSPIVHPRLREVRTGLGGSARKDVPPSPISLHDRYSSPTAGSAKRRLFGDDNLPESPLKKISISHGGGLKIVSTPSTPRDATPLSPARTLLTMAAAMVTTTSGQQLTIPVQGVANEVGGITFIQVQPGESSPLTAQALLPASPSRSGPGLSAPEPQNNAGKPRRTGSLALFFRKVYHLASVRLRDLCLKLDISAELRRKIWTCFECSLVHCSDLMKDRHLDQLLLCAVYIVSKVTKEEHTFQDIMKCYRSQPQASSHVYRSVLLKERPRAMSPDRHSMDSDIPSMARDAAATAGDSDSRAGPAEDRGDLIQFYNTVYVLRMKEFAQKYARSSLDHRGEAPPLSPFPSVRAQPLSPRRVSQRHSVYVSPHKNGSCITPSSAITYRFSGSPSKNLRDINSMIKQGERMSRKRAFTMDSDSESPAKRLCQENEDVLLKRLQDVVSERANR
ncbi:retinoblastoma-like protein 1 isoform X1 [Lepisosteus oculatus]|uniref:retinoblastoma-like protein 1 isoform X1 n=1 Tax=Lepisosteus oculatus TaxID=7918 RepID=UPI000740177A|nr:PREDICTED: retinoblastoma-like protein 1 isoform X1 [Lepisosteus oculatus]